MRLTFIALLVSFLCTGVRAQIPYLHLSPFTTTEMTIATTDIEFSYGRPSLRGRKIFGGLEPWDVVWRGGANRNPRLVMSQNFKLGDTPVKAGSYTLFMKPTQTEWTVYLYDEINKYGSPEPWDEAKVVATIKLPPAALPRPIETLHYTFEEISNDHFTLVMEWETTRIVVPFRLTTAEQMSARIQKTLNGPSSAEYSNAGMYALRDSKDYEQAVAWFDKAIELDETPGYWEPLFRAQALEKLGRKAEAITGAKLALGYAKKSGSNYGVRESEALIERLK